MIAANMVLLIKGVQNKIVKAVRPPNVIYKIFSHRTTEVVNEYVWSFQVPYLRIITFLRNINALHSRSQPNLVRHRFAFDNKQPENLGAGNIAAWTES